MMSHCLAKVAELVELPNQSQFLKRLPKRFFSMGSGQVLRQAAGLSCS